MNWEQYKRADDLESIKDCIRSLEDSVASLVEAIKSVDEALAAEIDIDPELEIKVAKHALIREKDTLDSIISQLTDYLE